MTNLWEETIKALSNYDKTFEDVIYIQGSDFAIAKENFERIAKATNYDDGYGSAYIATDLIVVGKNWWLERGEYDGMEWWEYKETPELINKMRKISHLGGGFWPTLEELNKEEVQDDTKI